MKTINFFSLLLLLLSMQVAGQVQHSGWVASFNTFKLNNKWSVHFDAQFRSSDKMKHLQTILLRPGINYHYKNFTLSGGYAYIPGRRTIGVVTDYLSEHRAWEQAIYAHKLSKLAISHRFRFEQRFLPIGYIEDDDLKTDEYNKAYRIRYFIRNIFPLVKEQSFKKGMFVALQNEIFINTGDKSSVNGKAFDQNRFYSAVGYRLPSKIDLEAGYINQYINGRTSFTNNHVLQLAVYKRL